MRILQQKQRDEQKDTDTVLDNVPFYEGACVCARVPSLFCVTLTDSSLPGSSVHDFSRQEYWSGLLFPIPGNLSDPGIKPVSLNVFGIGRWVLYH